jgi:hypothetical protein
MIAKIQKIQNQHHKQISSFLRLNAQSLVRARATSECYVLDISLEDIEISTIELYSEMQALNLVVCSGITLQVTIILLIFWNICLHSWQQSRLTAMMPEEVCFTVLSLYLGTYKNFPLYAMSCENSKVVEAYAETNGCVAEITSDGNVWYWY